MRCTISIATLLLLTTSQVKGHGYMASPRSRQAVAAEDGKYSGGDNVPAKENCPSCANTKNADGFCGKVETRDYDNPLKGDGSPLPPMSQAIYTEGQFVDMEFVFTANHQGHHITYACPDFHNPTQECFDKYQLEFIEDLTVQNYGTTYNAPKDENYPNRAYVDPAAFQTKMRFKLPEGLYGDPANDNLVLLQWHWVTGNSCLSEGYDTYPFPPGWSPDNMGPCPEPLSNTGVDVPPEQFWNCAEVQIFSATPTTPLPTSPPVTAAPTVSTKPTNTTPAPVTAAPVTSSPTSPPGTGCCSQNFKDCDATWCGDTEAQCTSCGTAGDKTWLPNGAITGCIVRFGECTSNVDECCAPSQCTGDQYYRQCLPDLTGATSSPVVNVTPAPVTEAPVSPVTHAPVSSPNPPVPTVTGGNGLFSTTQTRTSYEALLELEPLTNIIQDLPNTPIYALVAEGGAAGNGNVVSEGQAYAVMIAGITLAAMEISDPNRQNVMDRFYGYFNGWKRMCENSTPYAYCQSMKFCNGGTTACLPGWKHDGDLTNVVGTGAAPDGDEDAISGMIMAVKAVENDAQKPAWYDEVRKWADASSTSFLLYNTKASSSGLNRIVKLGTCWGGWEGDGNNPSYHSPGSYRLMKDYQADFVSADREYNMPNFDDGLTLEERWLQVINTSYDVLDVTQCNDMGLVPNWALVTETNGAVNSYPGSFSGSGTPQYEFGSEASRTLWRVLFDVALHPQEAFEPAEHFLNPVHDRLDSGFDSANNDWNDATLGTCDGVTAVFSNWRYNAFIYAPVYSTLVLEASGVPTAEQQEMVDAAGAIVDVIPTGTSYYSRCWSIIGILTLNGDVAKAAANVLGGSGTTSMPISPSTSAPTLSPSKGPTMSPTGAPVTFSPVTPSPVTTSSPTVDGSTDSPTPSPTPSPTTNNASPSEACCSNNHKDCNMDEWCNENETQCGQCGDAMWLSGGALDGCIARWGACLGNEDGCCGPASCMGDEWYKQCL